MQRFVAFLRGMNIGDRRIKNDDLRARFEELGLDDVATFRASGNVIFSAESSDGVELAARIEAGLGETLGYEVPVFLRSAAELRAIAEHEPFEARLVEASAGKLQISLLLHEPKAAASKEALALSTDEDRLAIHGRELYWLPSSGISESELDLNAIGATLGLTTTRTKGTIDQIVANHLPPDD
jgi:uncharacterized protein (DUF1697 family)